MLIYDPETYHELRRYALPHGTRLWLMTGVNGVYEINPENGKIKQHKLFQTPIRGLTFLNDAILASGNNALYLLETKKLALIKHYKI